MNRANRWIPLLALPMLLGLAAETPAAKPVFDVGLDVGYDDNVGRAEEDSDRLSDQIITAQARVSYTHFLDDHSGLTLRAGAELVDYADLDGLDHHNLSLALNYRIKPDLGFTAPWYSLELSATRARYQSSTMRNGYLLQAEGMVGKRFTERLLGRLRLGYRQHNASDREKGLLGEMLFDTDSAHGGLGLDYLLGPLTLYGEYTYSKGDVVSTGKATRKIVLASDEIQQDDAIPRDGSAIRWAYRLNGATHLGSLGANYAISPATALDLNLLLVDVNADGGNRYDDYLLRLGLMHRF